VIPEAVLSVLAAVLVSVVEAVLAADAAAESVVLVAVVSAAVLVVLAALLFDEALDESPHPARAPTDKAATVNRVTNLRVFILPSSLIGTLKSFVLCYET